MISVTLVSGFLGAGKSTWLAGQLSSPERTRVIVNDVGDTLPDEDLVEGQQTIRILGGCVCCERADELTGVLRRLCDERHAGARIESVVIETSGLSEPNNVADLIREDKMLSRNIVLAEIVVVVDGLLGHRDLWHEPLAVRQLASADRVIVTKTDLCPATVAVTTIAAAKAVAPTAQIQVTPNPHGLTESSIPARTTPILRRSGVEASRPATTTTLRLAPDVDWVVLASWLAALLNAHGEDVLRIKGNVPTANGPLSLSAVRGLMHTPRACSSSGDGPSIVIVSREIDRAALTAGWARFEAAADTPIAAPPRLRIAP